ncbi:MAG TPA: DUF3159 domain-containing protein [Candidatus Nanopelagicales bacterium]|nr:DUF3159 domain-containing protein [Candidatus Nanopelagicales bacterium]
MTPDVPGGAETHEDRPDGHEHHEVADALRGGVDEGSGAPGDATMDQLVADAIGGWRGMLDSSLPSLVFVIAYLVLASSDKRLSYSLWAALAAGAVVAVLRLARKQSMRQVLAGIPLLLLSAWLTSRTGRAEDFYLPGLLLNIGSAVVFLVSILVGHPVIGYFVGALTGDITGWRAVPEQRRAYTLATWFFFATYVIRVLVKLPLYWSANVAALGTIGLIVGWPLTALAAYFSYLVIVKARREAPVPARVEEPEQL